MLHVMYWAYTAHWAYTAYLAHAGFDDIHVVYAAHTAYTAYERWEKILRVGLEEATLRATPHSADNELLRV
jgi:hypothetical protein